MTLDDREKAAFESARDSSKQVLTLTTAVLALTITFADRVVGVDSLTSGDRRRLQLVWLLYAVSMVLGIWTLLSLTGALARPPEKGEGGIYASSVRLPAVGQMLAFLAATGMLVVYGWHAL